jgi:hypothetical protein
MAYLPTKLMMSAMAGTTLALASPTAAAPAFDASAKAEPAAAWSHLTGWTDERAEQRRRYRDRYDDRYYGRYDDEPIYRDTRTWRGRDGRHYCRKSDGTTGLIIGGAVGALLGREIDTRGDRTLGTLLGAAGGALLGKELDSKRRCR